MHSRLFFREHGRVIRIHSTARDAAWTFAAIAALLGLLAWGHAVDSADDGQGAFEAGLAVGQAQMQDTVAEAYRLGMVDALAQWQAQAQASSCPPPAVQAPQAQRVRPMLLSWGAR